MAVTHSFRRSIGGFNREDVVHYIEYLNSKHTAQVHQLQEENQQLQQQVAELQKAAADTSKLDELQRRCEQLQEQLTQANADNAALTCRISDGEHELAQLRAERESREQELATKELEAYRRAEQVERVAKERADQIYQQATGTLAQATTQVDQAASMFRQIADQVTGQMSRLQSAVDSSRSALMDAASTMYAIRPED